jgi:hypothetical protein
MSALKNWKLQSLLHQEVQAHLGSQESPVSVSRELSVATHSSVESPKSYFQMVVADDNALNLLLKQIPDMDSASAVSAGKWLAVLRGSRVRRNLAEYTNGRTVAIPDFTRRLHGNLPKCLKNVLSAKFCFIAKVNSPESGGFEYVPLLIRYVELQQ